MPQGNEKTSNGAGSRTPTKDHHSPLIASDAEDQKTLGKEKSDVKEQEDLEFCEGTDNMPELKDPELEDDEQVNLDLKDPPPEVMEYARRELGETDEIKCQSLQEFRDIIYGNSNWNICLK